jgi:hypothetical protein
MSAHCGHAGTMKMSFENKFRKSFLGYTRIKNPRGKSFSERVFDPREFCSFRFHADQKHTRRWRLCGVRF